ncbi:MAG TPA: hypothetical protein VJW17_04965, partial [Pyrinomonadaceae bacterium]|nr:hypothetical protein [Pyrinomonadaceae bacterium]
SVQAQQASGPTLLSYNELVALYETDPPSQDLANKPTCRRRALFGNVSELTRPTMRSFTTATRLYLLSGSSLSRRRQYSREGYGNRSVFGKTVGELNIS